MASRRFPATRDRWSSRTLRLLYQPYKYLVFVPWLALSTMFFATLTLALMPLLELRLVSRLCGVSWARLNAMVTPIKVAVSGRQHARRDQSYVVVSNHQSLYDVLVLYGWLGIDFRWVMKRELRSVPGLGVACQRLGHIYIDRSDHAAALQSLELAKQRIQGGTSVLFFPEGTRSRNGQLRPFKKGAFYFARELGLPILPVTIVGTRDVLPSDSTDLRPGRVRMIIHPPVQVDDESLGEMIDRTRAAVAGPLDPRFTG